MIFRKTGISLLTMGALLVWCAPMRGQTVYGSIAGTVLDASGAAIPGAAVSLTNLGTSEKRTMDSEASGSYTFVNLLPGQYRLEAEKSGFKHFTREPIVIEVGSALRIDVAMEIGAVTQTLEVKAASPLLQAQSSDLGQVVAARTVTEMPLNGRNPIALIQLVPGVVPQGPPSGGSSSLGNPVGSNPFGSNDFQVGGGQADQSAILIDGVPTNGSYLNVITIIPTQDALQEFKVQTNNLGPEFGRTAGGIINFTTKSGSNDFHGEAYEFLRNKVLDSNNFFNNKSGIPVGAFTQNQFGANVGGPLVKNKLFFFGSFEGYRLREGATYTTSVPTPDELGGDFSAFEGKNGNVIPIFDALTSTGCVAGGGTCRTQFSGNTIPAARIDPTAAALSTYIPAPTSSGEPYTHLYNFTDTFSTGGDTDQVNGRVDYNLSDRQRFFARFTYWKLLNLPDSPIKDICTDRCTENVKTKQIVLGDTFSLSPTSILDLHLGYTRYGYTRNPLTQGINLSSLGGEWGALSGQFASDVLPIACISQIPADYQWSYDCVNGTDGTGSEIGAHDDTWSFTPSFTKIKGGHTIKVGWEFRLLRNNYFQTNQPTGLYQFDAVMTASNPLNTPPATGSGIASFLLGYGNNYGNAGTVVTPSFMANQMFYNAFYAGDTWRATRKLTVNLGVRWDLQGNWTERFNRLVDWEPNAVSPVSSTMSSVINPVTGVPFGTMLGAVTLVDTTAQPPRTDERMPWNAIAPRIGLAYRVTDKTIVRTGYGIFYVGNDIRWNDAPHNLFINTFTQTMLATTDDGITPYNVLSNPFPASQGGVVRPAGRNQAWINQQGSGLTVPVNSNPATYVQQWNFDIQRELPDGTLIDLAYAGSKGTHLPMHSQDVDQLTAQDLPAANGGPGPAGYSAADLSASVPNPFYGTGLITSGSLTAPTVTAAHLLIPYPQYDDMAIAEPDDRDSIYHSFQMKIEKRFSHGGTLLASYTISKLISDTNNEINWLGDAAPSWGDVDAYNLHNERSLDGFDVPQRFVFSYIVDLPVGKGKRFGNNLAPVADKLVGGWGIDGIVTAQSGFPLNIGGAGALGAVPDHGGVRATRLGPETATSGSASSRLGEWFNTADFEPTPTYTYGNDSRTEPNLREDGIGNFDFALLKNTRFGPDEKLGLEFRAEFFNIFNHPMFSAPNTSCCGAGFGVVSSQYNLPRIIQFGLKFTF